MWRIDGPIEFWDGCNIEEHICVARRLHRAIRHNKIDTLYALQEISLSLFLHLSLSRLVFSLPGVFVVGIVFVVVFVYVCFCFLPDLSK